MNITRGLAQVSETAWEQTLRFFDLVFVPLGWQITIVIVLMMFASPLTRLIDRLKRWKKYEAEFGDIVEQPSSRPNPEPIDDARRKTPTSGPNEAFDPTLEYWINNVKSLTSSWPEEDKVMLLQDALAEAYRSAHAQFILRFIFGSQLSFLMFLEFRPYGWSEANSFYQNHISKAPNSHYDDARKWASFLLNQALVSDTNGVLALTPTGQAFVSYCKKYHIVADQFLY